MNAKLSHTLHRSMTIALLTSLALVVGAMLPWQNLQHGQHGSAQDPQAHFTEIAKRLELSDSQQQALEGPLFEAFAAMQELHRLHEVIAAELTEHQRQELARMIHEAMAGSMSHHAHHPGHHGHHEVSHP